MRKASLILPSNPHPRRTDNWLLDLPTEVRHAIYKHLFCQRHPVIWIARHYKLWPALQTSEPDPIFQTQLFRLCKNVHDDAVRYAYSFNDFELRDDFATFCQLGKTALSSIRNLIIVQGAWREETEVEAQAWSIIGRRCSALNNLEVILHADMLIPAIPVLGELVEARRAAQDSQAVAIDLHVWDRHFSFDTDNRDSMRAKQLLEGTHVSGPNRPKFIPPRDRIMRLPTQAQQIILTADVTPGTIKALDDYLVSLESPLLTKSLKDVPQKGFRAAGGRSNRYWYDLEVG